jgi:hypothetical protein
LLPAILREEMHPLAVIFRHLRHSFFPSEPHHWASHEIGLFPACFQQSVT